MPENNVPDIAENFSIKCLYTFWNSFTSISRENFACLKRERRWIIQIADIVKISIKFLILNIGEAIIGGRSVTLVRFVKLHSLRYFTIESLPEKLNCRYRRQKVAELQERTKKYLILYR